MSMDKTAYHPAHRSRLVRALTRRELLTNLGGGASALALAALLGERAAAETTYDLKPRAPHFTPKVKRVIYLFQNGGASQVDLFDPKPELKKRDGQKPGKDFVNDVDAKKTGLWLGSPFAFLRYGK